ncbi:MAG: CdaR family protein [Treponemataceae bacterium]
MKKNEKKRSGKFIKNLTENWPAKIVCVLLAVLLYMLCRISTLDKHAFAIPLEVQNTGNLLYTNSLPKYVRVTVRGESASVALMQEKDFAAFVDLSSYVEDGLYKVPIQLQLSESATMIDPLEVQVSPDAISLKLERKTTGLCEARAKLVGNCAKGFEVSSYSISPDKVQITGVSSQVIGTGFLETSPINIANKNESFSQKVKAVNQNKMLSITGQNEFTVSVKISPVKDNFKIENEKIYFMGLNPSFSVENSQISYVITLTGNQNDLEQFALIEDLVYVDCSDIQKTGMYTLPLMIKASEKEKVEKIEPETVNIKIIPHTEENDEKVKNKDDKNA